jgi:hypothetical protein
MFHGNVNKKHQKLFGNNLQLPIFATRFETNEFVAVNKREVLYRKTLMVKILVVSLPSAPKRAVVLRKVGVVNRGKRGKKAKEKFG